MDIKVAFNNLFNGYIKKSIDIDELWESGEFSNINYVKMTRFNSGLVDFYSDNPEEIYNYLKNNGIKRIIPWEVFYSENEKGELEYCSLISQDLNFNIKKGKKKRKGHTPKHKRNSEIDVEHFNIKGQKSKQDI